MDGQVQAVVEDAEPLMGTVFNIMRYATHDGPGIRTVVFLKGCPLRCLWCHNPEGQSPGPELLLRTEKCIKCGDCYRVCPNDAILLGERHSVTLREKCRVSGNCVAVCPSGARALAGKKMTLAEVVTEIEKDTVFYDESDGGVTFSGGEPFLQANFLQALLQACSRSQIHTAVETCGMTSAETLLVTQDYVGTFLYDLKAIDDVKHREFTGVSNKIILENLKLLSQIHDHVVVRLPLVPDMNDSEEDIGLAVRFISTLGKVERIHLLPYHRAGIAKYAGLSRVYELDKMGSPADAHILRAAEVFRENGFEVVVGG